MNRKNITAPHDGSKVIGWFDLDRAQAWDEGTRWDGNNMASLATTDAADHERLIRTAQGRFVIHSWSQWVGRQQTYRYVTADQARDWLLRCEYLDGDLAEAGLGELPEESGPDLGGRPPIGGTVSIALGDDLLARVDAEAKTRGATRAALVRTACEQMLAVPGAAR